MRGCRASRCWYRAVAAKLMRMPVCICVRGRVYVYVCACRRERSLALAVCRLVAVALMRRTGRTVRSRQHVQLRPRHTQGGRRVHHGQGAHVREM